MVLPPGSENFVCMGHAVSDSPTEKPDPSKYCCAKKELLIKGEEQLLDSSFNKKILDPFDSETVSIFNPHFPQTYSVNLGNLVILQSFYETHLFQKRLLRHDVDLSLF